MSVKTNIPIKLSNLVENIYQEEKQSFDLKEFISEIAKYNELGKSIYQDGDLRKLSEKVSKLIDIASTHIVESGDDWFDKITLNKNAKQLKALSVDFKKTALEVQSLHERLTDLYENIGFILNKYYDIKD